MDLVPFLAIFLLLEPANQIYQPDDVQYQPQKPITYTHGIKTGSTYSRGYNQPQYHHNYSKVSHQNNYNPQFVQREENCGDFCSPSSSSLPVYVINGNRLNKNFNPTREILIYNKQKRAPPKLEILEKCPPGATGQFIHKESCNQFLNCWKGHGHVQNCAPGTLFNPLTLECDFPEKVQCVTGPRLNTLETEKSQRSTRAQQVGCPVGFTGLIPNYTDCSKFINCNSGIENFMDCPQGTLFDMNRNICDFKHKATCYNEENKNLKEERMTGCEGTCVRRSTSGCEGACAKIISQPQENLNYKSGIDATLCPLGFSGLHKHPSDCAKFLNCANGKGYVQDCPPGTLFNPVIKICDFPYNVRCENRGSGVGTTDLYGSNRRGNNEQNSRYYPSIGTYGGIYGPINSSTLGRYYPTTDSSSSTKDNRKWYPHGTPNSQVDLVHYSGNPNPNQFSGTRNPNPNRFDTHYYPGGESHHYGSNHRDEPGSGTYNRQNPSNVYGTYGSDNVNRDYNYNYNKGYGTGGLRGTQHSSTNNNCRRQPCSGNSNTMNGAGYGTICKRPPCTNSYGTNPGIDVYQRGETGTNCRGQSCFGPDRKGQSNTNCRGQACFGQGTNTYGASSSYDIYRKGQQSGTNCRGQACFGQETNSYGGRDDPYDVYQKRPNCRGQDCYGQDSGTYGETNTYGGQSPSNCRGQSCFGQGSGNYGGAEAPYSGRGRDPYYIGSNTPQRKGYSKGILIVPARGTNDQPWTPHQGPEIQGSYGTPRPISNDRRSESGGTGWLHQNQNNLDEEPVTIVNINRRRPQDTTRDYDDTFGSGGTRSTKYVASTPRSVWPPPFPSTDVNADYVFEYDDNDETTLEPEVGISDGTCNQNSYHCSFTHCISKKSVCNGVKDCADGGDEAKCLEYVSKFSVTKDHRLAVLEKERWDNTSVAACALLCIETRKFKCRSFNYRKIDKTCFLSDANIGLTGALISYQPCDFYELKGEKIDCSRKFVCSNNKCIEKRQICDGSDDCGDRQDEKGCQPREFGYSVRLAGSSQKHQGRIEVTAFDKTGYVCDDQFGLRDADVVCRELGYSLGALEVKANSFFDHNIDHDLEPFYMMDDVTCLGNESKLMDCDFSGWGVHNCLAQEVVGVVCKTPQQRCSDNYWQCDSGQECIPLAFVCDGLLDCSDGSDETRVYCEAPTEMRLSNGSSRREGRVEVKHHGLWGTICDDDFNEEAAKVICRQLGYRGAALVKKDAYFGPGTGPIWLDQVVCTGNESSIEECAHWSWGEHNCEHSEDVGVVCSEVHQHQVYAERHSSSLPVITPKTYPTKCGYRNDNIFDGEDDVHFRVVKGSVARTGDYPWQAAIRVKGKTKAAHWCGAVVISEKFVLTAAHCVLGYPKGAYVVVAGDYDIDLDEGTEQHAYVENYYIHEDFRQGHKMNNDIALVKLKGHGFHLDQDVQPICLPENDSKVRYDQLNCTVSGFGSTESGKSAFSHKLRAGWIPIQKKEVCTMPHIYGDALTQGMICAGSLDEGVDACDGDSGGPLACLQNGVFTLIGITSWGQHCGYANKPGVYVKVAHYRQWIDEKFNKHS